MARTSYSEPEIRYQSDWQELCDRIIELEYPDIDDDEREDVLAVLELQGEAEILGRIREHYSE
jgi:hypothetical protein